MAVTPGTGQRAYVEAWRLRVFDAIPPARRNAGKRSDSHMKYASLFAAILALSCSSKKSDTAPPPVNDASAAVPDAGFGPEVPLPSVWGTAVLQDINPDPHVVEVNLTAAPATIEIAPGANLDMWTFNGSVPGPLLHARVGDEVIVHFRNELAEPTTIHWHGLRIPSEMDGSPRVQEPVPAGGEFTYRFKVPEAGSFWYHPHVRSFDQIERGLSGPIIVRAADEPEFDQERIVFSDDILIRNGQIAPGNPQSFGMPGRGGNAMLVNGKDSIDSAGHANVRAKVAQGTVERWRLYNPSNARTMMFHIEGAKVRIIGTDGGLIKTPQTPKIIELAVGQRYDLEVTYDRPGTVIMYNRMFVVAADGGIGETDMETFAVDVEAGDKTPRTIVYPPIAELPNRAVDREVQLEFNAVVVNNKLVWQINGQDGSSHMHEPMFTFKKGETIRMKLVSQTGPPHPFHLHGQFFAVEGDTLGGLRDTVLVTTGTPTNITAFMDNPGRWMAHCHILEHSELGMMTEFVVDP